MTPVQPSVARRAAAEAVGTAFLVAAVIGSGIAATRLSPNDVGLQLLENSLVTGAALVALILALQPVSAAFNPVVTLIERALGQIDSMTTVTVIAAQFVGGVTGAVLANLMFDLDAISIAGTDRSGANLWLAETVATLGLVMVIFGSLRSGRSSTVAYAVGGYITAAYWFTSSTSFANPAVTVARMLSDTFAGIDPASVPLFILAQLVGGGLGIVLIKYLFPATTTATNPLTEAPVDHAHEQKDSHMTATPEVLFVCVHNQGRSQMAAGLLNKHAAGRVHVRSAGSEPADTVNPAVVEVMAEVGIDISQEFPKKLLTEDVAASDVVITMGCGDACPIFPGKRYEDWALTDPSGQGADAVRIIRDEIDQRVQKLLAELVG